MQRRLSSLDATAWKIALYARYQKEPQGDAARTDITADTSNDENGEEESTDSHIVEPQLMGGDLVYLHDPETHSYMRLLSDVERGHVEEAAAHAERSRAEKAARMAQLAAMAGSSGRNQGKEETSCS